MTAPGLHHCSFEADTHAEFDALYALLKAHDAKSLDALADYAHTKDYYAVLFADPDGLKLELCCAPYAYTPPTTRGDRDERRRIALHETQYQLDRD